MTSQTELGQTFAALHRKFHPLVVPNAFDAGTARLLTGLGFEALATTSSGLAFSLGLPDGANAVSRAETMANARSICAATHLPVTADLERCFPEEPDGIAGTIRLAAEAGLVGCSIEDATGDAGSPICEFSLAVERVHAAVEAARALPFCFTLTARAENFLHGRPDIDDTLRRLQAFERAGADVLYAPGLTDIAVVRTICQSVSRPVNVLAVPQLTMAQLNETGARRISLGSKLTNYAFGSLERASREMLDHGTFTFARDATPFATLQNMFSPA